MTERLRKWIWNTFWGAVLLPIVEICFMTFSPWGYDVKGLLDGIAFYCVGICPPGWEVRRIMKSSEQNQAAPEIADELKREITGFTWMILVIPIVFMTCMFFIHKVDEIIAFIAFIVVNTGCVCAVGYRLRKDIKRTITKEQLYDK